MAKSETPKASGEPSSPTPQSTGSRRLAVESFKSHQAISIYQLGFTESSFGGKPGHKFTLELGPEGMWIMPQGTLSTGEPYKTVLVPTPNIAWVVLK